MIEDPSIVDKLVDIWPVLIFLMAVVWAFPAAQRWYERQQAQQREALRERTRVTLRRSRHHITRSW